MEPVDPTFVRYFILLLIQDSSPNQHIGSTSSFDSLRISFTGLLKSPDYILKIVISFMDFTDFLGRHRLNHSDHNRRLKKDTMNTYI